MLWSAIASDSLPLTALPAYLGAHPLTTEFAESIADVELRSQGLAVALFTNRSTAAFASCVRRASGAPAASFLRRSSAARRGAAGPGGEAAVLSRISRGGPRGRGV